MSENEYNLRIAEQLDIDKVAQELRILREWTSGWGCPYEFIISENFPSLDDKTLKMFRELGEYGFKFDRERLDLREKYPETFTWPHEGERNLLIVAAREGYYDEMLSTLKKSYRKTTPHTSDGNS
jgi:hypothetical protein